jgi:ABC-type Fe3+/spermidine/putrescine transport system ATPase subunit
MSRPATAGGGAQPGDTSRPLVDVRVEGFRTRLGPEPHLDAVTLHARYGELLVVLGPPRSGKSGLLRAVAGFQPLAEGRLLVDGEDVTAVPPRRRGIGYVPQGGGLWPHMTVREHVVFGLAAQGLGPTEMDRRVTAVLRRLGLAEAVDRRPSALGAEPSRRLALARALAVEPRVLLLDEPLAHVEPQRRRTLRLEVVRLHRDLAVTTICATRDAVDALALADRVVVMHAGRVLQIGEPEQIYRRPATRAAAEALGAANFLPVQVVEMRELGLVVETERGDRLPVAGIGGFRVGDRGVLMLRPDLVTLTEAAGARGPGLPGRVADRVFEGARYLYEIDVGGAAALRVDLPADDPTIFRLGERVRVETSSDNAVLLAEDATPGA